MKTINIPLLEKEGWTRHQTRYCEATFEGADGVVSPAKFSGLKVSPIRPHLRLRAIALALRARLRGTRWLRAFL